MIRQTSGKLPSIYRSWKRSLVEDGDVEENPGPPTTISCLNVAGKHRTWNYIAGNQHDKGRAGCFINTWLNQGYNVFFPAECDKALVAIIVHNSLGFGEMFLENINAVSRYQMWWAMGDWNPTPCDQRIWSFLPANTKVHFVGNDGCARSMRWEGDKCACKTQSRKELCQCSMKGSFGNCWADSRRPTAPQDGRHKWQHPTRTN